MQDIPSYDEADLLLQIADGNENAFTALYRIYVPQLTPFIRKVTKSEVMVDEVIQEVFLRLWMNRDRLTEVRSAKAWIYKITANVCYRWIARMIVERKAKVFFEARPETVDAGIENNVQEKDLVKFIKEAVDQLSPQRKKIYLMSREQGKSLSEIGEQLGLTERTVKNTISTSLQQIREHLEKQGYLISFFFAWLIGTK